MKRKHKLMTLYSVILLSWLSVTPAVIYAADLDRDNIVNKDTATNNGFADAKDENANPSMNMSAMENTLAFTNPQIEAGQTEKVLTDLPGWTIGGAGDNLKFVRDPKGPVHLKDFYHAINNGRDMPWLTVYTQSKNVEAIQDTLQMLELPAGRKISKVVDVTEGQYLSTQLAAINATNAKGPNGVTVKYYNAETDAEIPLDIKSKDSGYPTNWGIVEGAVSAVPAGVKKIKIEIETRDAPMIIPSVDIRNGANLKVEKNIKEETKTGQANDQGLSYDNNAAYDNGRAIRTGEEVEVELQINNVGQQVTQGSVVITDKIPEGLEFVTDSVQVTSKNGVAIANLPADFFEIQDQTLIFRPVTNTTGIYGMRAYGNFAGFGYDDPLGTYGKYTTDSSALPAGVAKDDVSGLKITYKVRGKSGTKDFMNCQIKLE